MPYTGRPYGEGPFYGSRPYGTWRFRLASALAQASSRMYATLPDFPVTYIVAARAVGMSAAMAGRVVRERPVFAQANAQSIAYASIRKAWTDSSYCSPAWGDTTFCGGR